MHFLKSPYFIALILIVGLFIVLPFSIPPKHLEIQPSSRNQCEQQEYYFICQDEMGSETRFYRFKVNTKGQDAIVTETKFMTPVKQIDLEGKILAKSKGGLIADLDNNGSSDLCFLTLLQDTAYLTILHNPWELNHDIRHYPIDQYIDDNLLGRNYHLANFDDYNGDGTPEFLLFLNTGYRLQPRAVYLMDIKSNKVIKSDLGITGKSYVGSWDVDHDGRKEIFLKSKAVMNQATTDSSDQSDYHAQFLVLDDQCQQKYPVQLFNSGSYNTVATFASTINRDTVILAISAATDRLSVLFKYDPLNNQVDTLQVFDADKPTGGFDLINASNLTIQLASVQNGSRYVIRNGREKELKHVGKYSYLISDIFRDPGKEDVFAVYSPADTLFYLANHHRILTNKIKFKPLSVDYWPINIKGINDQGKKSVMVQVGQNLALFRYQNNPWYYARFPGLLLLYGFAALAIFLIQRQQKKIWDEQKKIKEEIQTLQYRAINNQLNPHFSFNMLNVIGYSILNDDRDKAYRMLTEYARLTRDLVETGHEISTSLSKEIKFLEGYLKLQKVRYEDSLTYSIEVDPSIDTSVLIPKMMLHTFVENAIKHGLSPLEHTKTLSVTVSKNDIGLLAVIEDNGVGIGQNGESRSASTGKGLEITTQVLDLFKKLTGQKVEYRMINLADQKTGKTGTRVEIHIN